MAKNPYLPLFTDAYLADTRHLTREEHGAYLLLLMEAWRRPSCSLPDDDDLLARLVLATPEEWARLKPVVMAFWKLDRRKREFVQKRLSAERKIATDLSAKQRGRVAKRWNKKENAHTPVIPDGYPGNTPNPTQPNNKNGGGGGAHAHAREAPPGEGQGGLQPQASDLLERVAAAAGIDRGSVRQPDLWFGPGASTTVGRWLGLGLTGAEIVAEVAEVAAGKRDGPPSSPAYFDQAMSRLVAARVAPQPAAVVPLRPAPPDTAAEVRAILARQRAERIARGEEA